MTYSSLHVIGKRIYGVWHIMRQSLWTLTFQRKIGYRSWSCPVQRQC